MPPAVEALSPNHWTAREVPSQTRLNVFNHYIRSSGGWSLVEIPNRGHLWGEPSGTGEGLITGGWERPGVLLPGSTVSPILDTALLCALIFFSPPTKKFFFTVVIYT